MAKREYIQANKDWLEAKAQEEDVDCTINVIKGTTIQAMYEEDPNLMNIGKEIGEGLFMQTYSRFLNFYRTDASTRYKQLLQRCPSIVMRLPLQEIASYLRVTPTTVSKIRKELLG